MHVALRCPCGASLKAPIKYVGRELKCPKCSAMLVVPEPPVAAASQPAELEALEPFEMPATHTAPLMPPVAAGAAASVTRAAKPPKTKKKSSLLPYLIGIGALAIAGAGVYLVLEYKKAMPIKDDLVIKVDGKALTKAELDRLKVVAPPKGEPPKENSLDSGVKVLASNSENVPDEAVSLQELIKIVEPSIVRIFVVEFSGAEKVGSGFFVDKEGKIFTNNHVIRGASKVTVETADGKKAEALGYLAGDRDQDLAIIQVNPDDFNCVPIAIANELPAKGEDVAAFGAPQGFSFSQSEGVVSSVRPGKEVAKILGEMAPGTYERHGFSEDVTWIQHSAAISGGNSGGPLVNFRGEMIGVNTWTHPGGQNLNFASTMEHVKKVFVDRNKTHLMKFSRMSANAKQRPNRPTRPSRPNRD